MDEAPYMPQAESIREAAVFLEKWKPTLSRSFEKHHARLVHMLAICIDCSVKENRRSDPDLTFIIYADTFLDAWNGEMRDLGCESIKLSDEERVDFMLWFAPIASGIDSQQILKVSKSFNRVLEN